MTADSIRASSNLDEVWTFSIDEPWSIIVDAVNATME
jgi:hypothetical protein